MIDKLKNEVLRSHKNSEGPVVLVSINEKVWNDTSLECFSNINVPGIGQEFSKDSIQGYELILKTPIAGTSNICYYDNYHTRGTATQNPPFGYCIPLPSGSWQANCN